MLKLVLTLAVSVISLVLASVIMGSTAPLKKTLQGDDLTKVTNSYNAATGILVFSLVGLMAAGMMFATHRGYKLHSLGSYFD